MILSQELLFSCFSILSPQTKGCLEVLTATAQPGQDLNPGSLYPKSVFLIAGCAAFLTVHASGANTDVIQAVRLGHRLFAGEPSQLTSSCSLNVMLDYQKKGLHYCICFQKEHRDVFCFVSILFSKGRTIFNGGDETQSAVIFFIIKSPSGFIFVLSVCPVGTLPQNTSMASL